jgi:hypothetical protein
MPNWYKARNGVRTKALSGAARVARFRPPKPGQCELTGAVKRWGCFQADSLHRLAA